MVFPGSLFVSRFRDSHQSEIIKCASAWIFPVLSCDVLSKKSYNFSGRIWRTSSTETVFGSCQMECGQSTLLRRCWRQTSRSASWACIHESGWWTVDADSYRYCIRRPVRILPPKTRLCAVSHPDSSLGLKSLGLAITAHSLPHSRLDYCRSLAWFLLVFRMLYTTIAACFEYWIPLLTWCWDKGRETCNGCTQELHRGDAQQARHADFWLHSTVYFNGCSRWWTMMGYDQVVSNRCSQLEYDDVSFTFNHSCLVSLAVAYVGFLSTSDVFVPNAQHMLPTNHSIWEWTEFRYPRRGWLSLAPWFKHVPGLRNRIFIIQH